MHTGAELGSGMSGSEMPPPRGTPRVGVEGLVLDCLYGTRLAQFGLLLKHRPVGGGASTQGRSQDLSPCRGSISCKLGMPNSPK